MTQKILFKHLDVDGIEAIGVYEAHGGYEALKKALNTLSPEQVIEEVKKSGLRGRGGAGFPTGMKWSFVPKESALPKYLCCNADESEPGTFKDRKLMEYNPHQLIEGIIISCYAVGINTAYIYIRGEFVKPRRILEKAVGEAYERGYLGKNILGKGFDLELCVHSGAGAYICGEETGLLESLEGKRGYPRLKPPFPANVGLFAGPTVINNVETLSNIPHIIMNGGEWFASIGTERNTGTKIYCLSGHLNKPGLYELPLGVPLRELLYEHGGGIRNGKKLKAVIPGGSSTPVLTADEIDLPMDFDSLAKAGSMLGSAGVIAMDETTCMVKAISIIAHFYYDESCGQCTPCREGTTWMWKILNGIEGGNGRREDPDLLLDICDRIKGHTICPLGDAAAMPVETFVRKFRAEFDYHIEHGRCMVA